MKRITVKHKGEPSTGVRYREHPKRKHGIKKDRYFTIRYQRDGVRKEEGLGWSSEGWTIDKALSEARKLKEAYRTGQGLTSLAEKRQKVKELKETEKAKKKQEDKDNITFNTIFHDHYFPIAKTEKAFKSHDRERGLFKNWVAPIIGELPLKDIAPLHLEKIKQSMRNADLSARSIEYCLATIRQIFNFAYRNNMFEGNNPVKKVKIPKQDNKRLRFLTLEEATKLLKGVIVKCCVWH